MAGAYTTGVRSELNKRGITNDRISYDPKSGVMVDNQSFMRPNKVYNGTAYSSPESFNASWESFNKPKQQVAQAGYNPTGTPTAGSTFKASGYGQAKPAQPTQMPATNQYNPYTQTTSQNPYTSQADQVIQQLLNYGQNQGNFDPYSSTGYKAAEAQAQRQAQQSMRSAQEIFGASGMGRSYGLGERAQGIQNDATNYLMTQVVPQLEAQEAQRRQQEYNNILQALSPLMAQQGRGDELVQQDFANNLATAELTGNYMPQGANDIIGQLMALKQQAEAPTITRDARAGLSSKADTLRTQLQAMGVDPALFGANVSQSQAAQNVNTAGQRTLDAQGQDYRQAADLRDYERGVLEADRALEYTAGRDAVADAQWQAEFDQNVNQFGLEYALDQAKQALNTQKESRIASGETTSKAKASTKAAEKAKAEEEFDPNMPLTMNDMYKYIQGQLPKAMQTYGPSNKNDLIERMILSNPNLSDKDIFKLYQKFGLKVPTE